MTTGKEASSRVASRRRSLRLPLQIPVYVYGRTPTNRPFRDVTSTLAISAHGALLSLNASLRPGQSVLLVHSITQEQRECRVVHVRPTRRGKRRVAIEFLGHQGDFWKVYSPVVDLEGRGRGIHP